MIRHTGTHRKTTKPGRTVAKVAIAGMVVGAPLALFAAPASAATSSQWDAVAQCESGGNWATNTGNGFYGGLQFSMSTWHAYGGQGAPQNASKSTQISVGERVLAGQGKGAWPVCGKGLGAASPSSATANSAPAPVAPKAAPKANTNPAPKANTNPAPKVAAPKASTSSVPKAGADYLVKSGDTLSTIAQTQNVQGGYQALYNLNQDTVQNVNLIYVGQPLALR